MFAGDIQFRPCMIGKVNKSCKIATIGINFIIYMYLFFIRLTNSTTYVQLKKIGGQTPKKSSEVQLKQTLTPYRVYHSTGDR